MATELCVKCKQAHPGRVCNYDENAECAETIAAIEDARPDDEPSKEGENQGSLRPEQRDSSPVEFCGKHAAASVKAQ